MAPTNAGHSCYATSDGLLMLGAYTPRLHRRMWAALGEPERPIGKTLEAIARHAEDDRAIIAARLRNAPTASWLSIYEAAGVRVSAVEDLGIARHSTWHWRVNQVGKGSRGMRIMPLMIVASKH